MQRVPRGSIPGRFARLAPLEEGVHFGRCVFVGLWQQVAITVNRRADVRMPDALTEDG